jgi:outer membrane murein-binding lipoprotein Lpp
MKRIFAIAAAVLAVLCASGCAGSGAGSSQSGSSGITMYGTIDEGVTFHK